MANEARAGVRLVWNPVLLGVSILAAAAVILVMSRDVMRQLETLATARSDNVQWTLSQTELMLARLETALVHDRYRTSPATLADVVKQFDLLYSQVQAVREGELYRPARLDPVFGRHLGEVTDFLDESVLVIDAGPRRLRDEGTALLAEVHRIEPVMRAMALRGNIFFATDADLSRERVSGTLLLIAEITVVLILALTLLALGLARLYRISQSRATALREARDRIEGVITTALDAVIMVDGEGLLRQFNPGAELIFGYSRDEAIGLGVERLIARLPADGLDTDTLVRFDRMARAKGARAHVLAIGRHSSGREFPVEMSASVVGGVQDELRVAFIRDVTARVQREADLREARDRARSGEQAKDRFIAMMSHEMRTPLNGILGLLQLMQGTRLSGKQRNYLDAMRASGELLLERVNDVLRISRSDAGGDGPEEQPFAPRALLEDIALVHQVLADETGNSISVTVDPEVPERLSGDMRKLRQVVVNLVANAVKFTRDGRIAVSAGLVGRTGDEVTLEFAVSDTGIGVPPESLGRIFDDFVRLENPHARDVEGSGLGLAIARRLTRAMGGEIWAESPGEGGTTVRVRVPLRAAPALTGTDLAPAAASDAGALPRRKILVVEDNEINRLVMREMLTRQGHGVIEARDGVEGIEAAAAQRFDLIFMDVSMPRVDGIAATRAIRSGEGASRDAPIVAVTAHALPSTIREFTAAGMNACIVKPLSFAEIGAVLQAHTGDARPAAPAPRLNAEWPADLLEALPPATLRTLLLRFLDEMDAFVAELPERIEPGGTPDGAAGVHRMAGAAATFGAVALREVLRRAEDRCKAGETVATANIAAEWTATRADLARMAEILTE